MKPTQEEMIRVFSYTFEQLKARSEQEMSESIKEETETAVKEIFSSLIESRFLFLMEPTLVRLGAMYELLENMNLS